MLLRDKLRLTEEQKARLKSEESPAGCSDDEPSFWVHFDKEAEEIGILNCHPVDDDSCSESSEDDAEEIGSDGAPPAQGHNNTETELTLPPPRRASAADDAF